MFFIVLFICKQRTKNNYYVRYFEKSVRPIDVEYNIFYVNGTTMLVTWYR